MKSMDTKIYSEIEMVEFYGSFIEMGHKNSFDDADVPNALKTLIPYARFWGITDDWKREQLISCASPQIIYNLKHSIKKFDDELDDWLAGPESTCLKFSDAYVAFSAMRMAADFAS
jgi:hypothetical protein